MQSKWVEIERAGQTTSVDRGAQLAVTSNSEPDVDGDLRGDVTEDRTDLRVAAIPAREPDGRLRVEVTLTNLGAVPADQPSLDASWLAGARFEAVPASRAFPHALSTPLAPGESRGSHPRRGPGGHHLTVDARAEGADLTPADNSPVAGFLPAPGLDLVTADQRLSRGIKVQVPASPRARAGDRGADGARPHDQARARVTLEPYVARTVTLRAGGAKLRSLRRHAPLDGPRSRCRRRAALPSRRGRSSAEASHRSARRRAVGPGARRGAGPHSCPRDRCRTPT